MARQVPKAAHGFPNRAKSRLVLIGAILPIAGDSPNHEARVFPMQHIRPKPHAFQIARAEILDQPIGAAEQRDQLRAIIRLFQIECDAELIAPMHAEPDSITIDIAAPTAHRVTAWRFDLDHLRTKVREQARGERGGDVMAKLHELQARKRQAGGGWGRGHGTGVRAFLCQAETPAGLENAPNPHSGFQKGRFCGTLSPTAWGRPSQ